MSLPAPIAGFFNLGGPGLVTILMMLVFVAVSVLGIVLIVTSFNRPKSAQPPPPLPTAASAAERLQQLEQLKEQKLISSAEYEERRRRVISGV